MIDALDIRRQSVEDAIAQTRLAGRHQYMVTYVGGTCDVFTSPDRLLRVLSLRDWHCVQITANRLSDIGLGETLGPMHYIYHS